MSFLAILDRVLPFLKKGEKQQGKVCPNGHVMHPSWDTCPYCLEMQQAMMGEIEGRMKKALTAMALMSGMLPPGRNPMSSVRVLAFECPGTGGTWS